MSSESVETGLGDVERAAWDSLHGFILLGMPRLERVIRSHDLGAVDYHLLWALAKSPGETRRLSDLAGVANVSVSRLSHRLGRLVALGHLTQSRDPGDGRVTWARLTAKGRRVLEGILANASARAADWSAERCSNTNAFTARSYAGRIPSRTRRPFAVRRAQVTRPSPGSRLWVR